MPSSSRKYGRRWAPAFEGFEGLEGLVEVRFIVVVVQVRGVAGGENLAWGWKFKFFSWVGERIGLACM